MTADLARRPQDSSKWWGLAAFAAAVIVTAAIGTVAVTDTAGQYQTLQQPSWAPPSWLFGPVWTVLYAMIAVSGWLVWRKAGFGKEISVYAAQLVLNALADPLASSSICMGQAHRIGPIADLRALNWTYARPRA